MERLLNVNWIKELLNYLIKILSQKQNSKNNALSIREYRYLANLLQNGISLNDSLEIIKTKKNEQNINSIFKSLLSGENIESVLFNNDRYKKLFSTFNHLYTLDKSIVMVVDIVESVDKERKELISKLIYPLLIVFVSMLVMYFGCFELIPNMIAMLSVMGMEGNNLLLYTSQVLVVLMISFFLIGLLIVFIGYYLLKNNMIINICKSTKNIYIRKIFSVIFTYHYLYNYLIFIEKNMSTKEIQEIMLLDSSASINYNFALALQKLYEEGYSFVEAIYELEYFDNRAKQLIKIGYITNSLIIYINIYINEVKDKLQKYIKSMIIVIQGISYVSVCICVLTITNLLFEPLKILEGI